jgi:drug/metabolite transporter (DMT)-like permease
MGIAVIYALLSAGAYGVATVLQTRAARAVPTTEGVSPRLLVNVLRQAQFVVGVVLDTVGFVLQFLALRDLPLFVVQAVQASNLAVTAIVAIPLLRLRLAGRHWLAVGLVCLGLAMLAVAGGQENPRPLTIAEQLWLLAAALVLAVVGAWAGRLTGVARSVGLGLAAGLGFGITALSIRGLPSLHLGFILRSPATYALIVAGVTAFLFFATGLQQGAVTTVTAAVVVAETAPPAALGVLLLGDHARPGFFPVALLGFILSVAGALMLSQFSQPVPTPP